MRVRIKNLDDAPAELRSQTPFDVQVLRRLEGPDRHDYWLGKLERPIFWNQDGSNRAVTHVVLASKLAGMRFAPGMRNLPVGIAYVTDETVLQEKRLDFSMCSYVAIGLADDLDSSLFEALLNVGQDKMLSVKRALGRIFRHFRRGSN